MRRSTADRSSRSTCSAATRARSARTDATRAREACSRRTEGNNRQQPKERAGSARARLPRSGKPPDAKAKLSHLKPRAVLGVLGDRLPPLLAGDPEPVIGPRRDRFELSLELPPAAQPVERERAVVDCGEHRAARFSSVGAVAKAALRGER